MENNQAFEQCRTENEEFRRALATVERHLQTALAEKEQVNALYQDFKMHYEQMRAQSSHYQKRLGEEMQAKKELELGLESRLGDMRRAIEQKQREIDQMANKMSLPIDTDIMRMKIQKDIEARHRVEIDHKQQEVDKISEQFYEVKRQLDVVNVQLETQRHDAEKEVRDLKDISKREVNDLLIENQTLQSKADDKRDRELIRQLRRDLDEHKRRSSELIREATELRRERDQLKLEKNEQFVQFTRDLEEDRSSKRQVQSDFERAEFKFKCQQDDFQKMQLKLEKKQSELHRSQSEKNSTDGVLKSREQMNSSLEKQVQSLKEELRVKELEAQGITQRKKEDERDLQFQLREERARSQKENDKLEKQLKEIQTIKGLELQNAVNKLEQLQQEHSNVNFECKRLQNELSDEKVNRATQESQLNNCQKDLQIRINELERIRSLQKESKSNEANLAGDKERAESLIGELQEQLGSVQYQGEMLEGQYTKEKQGLGSKIQELISSNERIKLESNRQLVHFKTKYGEYKQKLRRANQNISTLLSRVAKFDIQLTAEREERGDPPAWQSSPEKPNQRRGGVYNHNELMAQDNLNEEITKLLAEQNM